MASTPNTFYNNNHFLDRGSKGIAGSFKEYEYDKNGNLIADYNKQIDIAYNPLNLPQSVVWANGQRIDWVYSASGEKLQKIVKDSLGAVVYTKSYLGNYEYVDSSLEAIYFSEGRATPGQGGAFAFEYAITDHLGNGRVWWRWDEEDLRPEVLQAADYYPFGLEQANPNNVQIGVANPYKFNGSVTGDVESMKAAGLGMEEVNDYGLNIYHAFYRTYDPEIGRMMQVDPNAANYVSISPYAFVANNPLIYIDPDGRDIVGVTKKDAQTFKADIHKVLSAEKFAGVRALIDIKGKQFNHISSEALTGALGGVELSVDERAYINMVTNTINSDDIHKIEYLSGDFTSSEGATAFKDHMNSTQAGVGEMMLTPEGNLSTSIIDAHGGGLNVPTKKGSHSFIGSGVQGDERTVTSGHELFGHGIPSSKGLSPAENNSNAIRTDNLIRRLLGMPQRDGSDHGGYREGQIKDPQILPLIND